MAWRSFKWVCGGEGSQRTWSRAYSLYINFAYLLLLSLWEYKCESAIFSGHSCACQVQKETHFPYRSILKNHSSMQWKLDNIDGLPHMMFDENNYCSLQWKLKLYSK